MLCSPGSQRPRETATPQENGSTLNTKLELPVVLPSSSQLQVLSRTRLLFVQVNLQTLLQSAGQLQLAVLESFPFASATRQEFSLLDAAGLGERLGGGVVFDAELRRSLLLHRSAEL